MVAIPIYNVELYLRECLDSVLSQKTRYTFCVVAVDDGSTDNSDKILDEYAGNPHIIIIHQNNRGFSGARNRGMDVMRGRYVAFVDSDDRMPQGAIDTLLNKAFAEDADIVQGSYLTFSGNKILRQHSPEEALICSGIYKSELWRHVQFPEKYWFEDSVRSKIICRLAKKTVSISEIIYEYRINEKSITQTSKGNPKVIDTLWITLQLLKDFDNLGLVKNVEYYNTVLAQIITNSLRIQTLHNQAADYANFLISMEIYQKYCILGHNSTKYKRVEKSLRDANFKHFQLACWMWL